MARRRGWFRRFLDRIIHPRERHREPPPPVTPPPVTPPGEPREPEFTDWVPRESELPAGWRFEGLFYEDPSGGTGRKVTNTDPTDSEIEGADAIIVSYTDALGKDYRTIWGATGRRQIGKLITTVTLVVSPPR